MKNKKVLSIILAVMMLVGLLAMPAGALEYGEEWDGSSATHTIKFKDLPTSHWAYQNVMRVVEKGWFSGYPDNTFRPSGSITRAEAVTVFVQFLGMEKKDVTTPTFYDVDVNKWYAPYIEAGKDLLPVHTNPDGKTPFRPDMPVTREDTMYALVVALGYDSEVKHVDESVLNMFSDRTSISRNMRPYIAWAVNAGLVAGKSNGTIGAQDPLTRAEFATLLYRGSTYGFNDNREAKLESVTLNPSDPLKQLKVGESFTIRGEGLYSDGTTKEYEVTGTYNADANGVVSINQNKITAENPGSCVIKFRDENLQDKSIVIIVTRDSGEVSLNFSRYDATTYEQFVTITGTARDSKGDKVTLTCNNKSVMLEDNGSFTHVVQLNMGRNTLEFVAKNSVGTSTSKTIEITRKDMGQVSISLDNYSSSTYNNTMTFSGRVSNTGSGTSTLTYNGRSVTLDGNGAFSFNVDLRMGDNTFNFEAKNEAGVKTTKSVTIVRMDPGSLTLNVSYDTPPENVYDAENGTMTVVTPKVVFTGSVYNSKGGRITLTCDGQNVSVAQDGTFTFEKPLEIGRNTFELEAKNEGGVTEQKTIIIDRPL